MILKKKYSPEAELAVKLLQYFFLPVPTGEYPKVGGYHVACYESLPHIEMELMPPMLLRTVRREELISLSKEVLLNGDSIIASFEEMFPELVNEARRAGSRWFQPW